MDYKVLGGDNLRIDSWLKISEKDGIDFSKLKRKLTLPNPDYVTRVRLGYSTYEFEAHGKCQECGKQLHKRYQNKRDIPKKCEKCKSDIRYVVEQVEIDQHEYIYKEIGNELWVPRGFINKFPDHKYEDNTILKDKVDFKCKIKLGPNEYTAMNQEKFVTEIMDHFKGNYGAIGQSAPGSGKTATSIEIMARIRQPTIVIVHKEFLMNQWVDRIQSFTNIDKDDIGFIQQDVVDYKGKKVVIAMLQSLLSREYPQEMYDSFGLVICDEVHRLAAREFRKTITMFPAKYRLGITATVKRKDNMENVFLWHIGDIASVGEQEGLKPKIKFVKTEIDPTSHELRQMYDWKGKQNLNKVTDYLINSDKRNRTIVNLLIKALKSDRKIMVLSGRLAHLEQIKDLVNKQMIKEGLRYTVGYYIGGMSEKDRTISSTRNLILATYAMAEEGLDIPDMDTLFLSTPKSAIEQSVGRILRMYDGKKDPMVIDFSDPIEICIGMLKKRMNAYKKLGYID